MLTARANGHRNGHRNGSMIVDQYGREMSYGLYPTTRNNTRGYRPRATLSPDTKRNVSQADREEAVNICRQLFAQTDILNSAVNQKNNWAFGDGWDYHYTGTNKEWRVEVENYINNQFFPNCNIRGPLYDFKTSLFLSGVEWDISGDDAMVLTSSADGFPQLAFYPSTKISSRGRNGSGGYFGSAGYGSTGDLIEEGEFSGMRIIDGIIYDKNSRPQGLRIVGDDDQFTDISSYHCDLAYEPQFHDQGRGWPKAWTGQLRWMDIQDIDDFIRRGVKLGSAINVIEKNEEGEAPAGNEVISGDERAVGDTTTMLDGGLASDRRIAFEEIRGGEIRYLSAPGGESLEAFNYQNPHKNVEDFIERTTRGSLASIGWHIELMDLSSTGRAPSRILCALANQSIGSRQKQAKRRARRAIGYAIGLGMKNGFLSRNDDGHDAYLFQLGMPAPITVDAGNEAAADREAFKMGLTNRSILMQKWHGLHYREVDKQRGIELMETIEAAIAISKKHSEITFDRALELLEQRSPNPIAQLPKTQDKQTQSNPPTKKAP